jgi:uncharacterized protein YjfI (DUF2170 family)
MSWRDNNNRRRISISIFTFILRTKRISIISGVISVLGNHYHFVVGTISFKVSLASTRMTEFLTSMVTKALEPELVASVAAGRLD